MVRKSPKVILAGSRSEIAALADPLREKGCEVQLCPDGGKALEAALGSGPDLLVLDTELTLIPAQKLFQILRANPRTEGAAFFFIGREGEEVEGFRRHRDFFVARPFNPDQALAGILGYLTRKERTEQVSRQEKEIEGNLNQISLVDLLQIFHYNRKDGVLALARGEQRGEIHLAGGGVKNARIGSVEGEKAFFRLLAWDHGKFWFTPHGAEGEARIARPTDHLIMEGLRLADEMAAQADQLPAPGSVLTLQVPVDRLPRGLRPATQEVLLTLQYYHRVADILDHSPQPDFEVLQILKVLIDKGLVAERREEPEAAPDLAPLLNTEEVLGIKERLGERDILLEEASAKLIVLGSTGREVRHFALGLQGLAEFEPNRDFPSGDGAPGLGDLGRLVIGDSFSLRLFCLPAGTELAPLWYPFRRRLFGVVSLSATEAVREAEEFFKLVANVPVVRVNADPGEGEKFPLPRGDRKSMRRLLGFFAAYYTGKLIPEEEP